MRKLSILLFFALMTLMPVKAQTFATIESPGAGKLEMTVDALLATHLTVKGHIDARDFKALKRATISRTVVLDLSEAIIEAFSGSGGCKESLGPEWIEPDTYHSYPANTLPMHAFTECRDNSLYKWLAGSTSLRKIILPSTLVDIEPQAMKGCSWIEEIECPKRSILRMNGPGVYTSDNRKLVAVAPGWVDRLDIEKEVREIAEGAMEDLRPACIKFHSSVEPEIKPGNTFKTAYIIANDNTKGFREAFADFTVLTDDDLKEVVVTDVTEGNLMTALGNAGLTRESAHNVKITGKLNAEDLTALFDLPNLYRADLSATTTSAKKITVGGNSLTELFLPRAFSNGACDLTINSGNFLCGRLDIPEGVGCLTCNNPRLEEVTFPSSLYYIGGFTGSRLKSADLQNCQITSLVDAFSDSKRLESLVLPSCLTGLKSVRNIPISIISLPKGLQKIEYIGGWNVEHVTFPASLTSLNGFGGMPFLKSVDFSACASLTYVSGFDGCHKLNKVDLSNTALTSLYGFGSKYSWETGARVNCTLGGTSSVVVTGRTRYPALELSGIEEVVVPLTLRTISGFNNAEKLKTFDLEKCYALTTMTGFENCKSLQEVKLPASITKASPMWGSTNLRSIRIAAVNPPQFESQPKDGQFSDLSLVVPNGRKGAYAMGEGWSQFKNVTEGGYSVNIKVSSPVEGYPLLSGAGMYAPGSTVSLSASSFFDSSKPIMKYELSSWTVNGTQLPEGENSFVINDNAEVYAIYDKPVIDKSQCALSFEVTSPRTQTFSTDFVTTDYSSVTVYRDLGGTIAKFSQNGSYDVTALAGKQTFYVVGNIRGCTLEKKSDDDGLKITRFEARNAPYLQYLSSRKVGLELLSLKGCGALETLYVSNNELTELDLSDCSKLNHFESFRNNLQSLLMNDAAPLDYFQMTSSSVGFSFVTSNIYNKITREYTEAKPRLIDYYIDEEKVDAAGCLDLTKETYDNKGTSPTVFTFHEVEQVIENPAATFVFKTKGDYYLEMTNKAYPKLKFYSNFTVNNPTSIEGVLTDGMTVDLTDGKVTVSGLASNSRVRLISLDSKVIDESDGGAHGIVSLSAPSHGVYLLQVTADGNTVTMKFRL